MPFPLSYIFAGKGKKSWKKPSFPNDQKMKRKNGFLSLKQTDA
ncbi:hypothetical protein BRO54_1521 [Geobacillus proteiniphilus]|uniref:Uncharacterized protein n=1 Tax=Geobacillus proteiniphilus TaxID=860353 RepID=A0A1Q5T344_9BACL|nr:hypothetical protein BRO54_1521 [Geobacillus proteiniphilus]